MMDFDALQNKVKRIGTDWALVEKTMDSVMDMDEGEECHGCALEYECSLSPDVCGGPYEEVLH